ncbi:MAG: CoA pyrophosphatase [Betaproteobacteria bacterium]|nr:CoA pyrophosphatase [Betaproteobacteria bacterium]
MDASHLQSYSIDWLRRTLAGKPPPPASFYCDDETLPGAARQRPASVLVPVIAQAVPTVLFTVRSNRLRSGAGQISFPGGGAEAGDLTPEHTALRETAEEVGLAGERVEILGRLAPYVTRNGYCITPVIGVVRPPLTLAPNHNEVAEIFEVPLWFLFDPRNHLRHSHQSNGRLRHYYALQYGDYYIRGVTAGLVVNLYRHIAGG